MNVEEISTTILLTLLGSGGILGIIVTYLKRYIDKRLEANEKEAEVRLKNKMKRLKVEDQLYHAYGRCLFWLNHAVTKPPPNGELAEAMEELNAAEEAKKDLDREILAQYSGEE